MDDYPDTLRLLSALLGHRTDREDLGYQPTEFGAFVDWDRLATGKLSSTEIGTVRIAHGCAPPSNATAGPTGRLNDPREDRCCRQLETAPAASVVKVVSARWLSAK